MSMMSSIFVGCRDCYGSCIKSESELIQAGDDDYLMSETIGGIRTQNKYLKYI